MSRFNHNSVVGSEGYPKLVGFRGRAWNADYLQSSLGKVLATCFGRSGAKIVLSSRNIEELSEAESELARQGINVTPKRDA